MKSWDRLFWVMLITYFIGYFLGGTRALQAELISEHIFIYTDIGAAFLMVFLSRRITKWINGGKNE